MSFDPTYPSKILILDSNRKIKGNTTNFTCQLDKSYVNSEGNFYCKLLDVMIDHVTVSTKSDGTNGYIYPSGGMPEFTKGLLGVKSNLAMNNSVVGTIDEGNSTSNLNGLIGYATVVNESMSTAASQDQIINQSRDKYNRTFIRSLNNSWIQCKSPNGMIDIQLVDGNGDQIPLSKNYSGYSAPSTRDQVINNVIVIVEVIHVNPLKETIHQLKARRNYQTP